MTPELTPSEARVLKLLARIDHPVGYFGLVARLEIRKRLLKQHLAEVLQNLADLGLIDYQPTPGYRFGAYALTAAGRALLEAEFGPAAGE